MGLKIPLFLFLGAAAFLRAEEPGRPPFDASRSEIRAYRIALKQARNVVRDSARRENNVLVGFVPSVDLVHRDPDGNPRIEENTPCLGFTVAYRTHFNRMLGVKVGSQFYSGSTTVSEFHQTPDPYGYGYPYETSSDGSKGTTFGINNSVQAVFGPFGRLALEPGLGVTWGAHSADTLVLNGDAGLIVHPQEKHFAFYDGILAASLYFGNKDQFDVSPSIVIGFSPALRNTMKYQFNLALVYAFQLPKEKG